MADAGTDRHRLPADGRNQPAPVAGTGQAAPRFLNDPVTGLRNRTSLEADIEAATAAPGAGWALVLIELEGFEAHNDRLGYAAGDEVVRSFARQLLDAVIPLGGIAYRIAGGRLAVLVPTGERAIGEIVLATTGALLGDHDASVGRSHGEVTIPDEAGDVETAF